MNKALQRANAKQHYKITRKDLPLSCPSKKMQIWDSHPRVALSIEDTGEAVCPYCSAQYMLVE